MSNVLKRMLYDVDVRYGVTVKGLIRSVDRWKLRDERGGSLGEYDALVVATPAPQAAELIDPSSFTLASRIREAQVVPCWALMLSFPASLDLEWDAAFSNVGPIAWLARESSKPERQEGERWVLHASGEWSARHFEDSPETVTAQLLDALFATSGARRIEPSLSATHRWRTALTTRPLHEPCLWDGALRLAACGDWCLGPRLEDSFLSGSAAAGRINALPPESAPGDSRPASQLPLFQS